MTPNLQLVAPYSEKRLQWLDALKGDDRLAITRQLSEMAWDATVFQIVNTARGLAPRDKDGALKINGLVHQLLNKGFFQTQMIAIRRLADSGYKFDDKKKGVWSLVSLLDDMRANQSALSRGAILEVEGLFYDYKPLEHRWAECYWEHHQKGNWPDDTPDPIRIGLSECRHKHIDRLAKVSQCDRSPEDRVSVEVFDILRMRILAACEDVARVVTKFIAHSATPKSRASVNADDVRLTLTHIEEAHRALCEVASFLAIYILGDAMPGFLATPQYDQFEHIQRPLVKKAMIPQLDSLWISLRDKYHDWSQWRLEEFETYARQNRSSQ